MSGTNKVFLLYSIHLLSALQMWPFCTEMTPYWETANTVPLTRWLIVTLSWVLCDSLSKKIKTLRWAVLQQTRWYIFFWGCQLWTASLKTWFHQIANESLKQERVMASLFCSSFHIFENPEDVWELCLIRAVNFHFSGCIYYGSCLCCCGWM